MQPTRLALAVVALLVLVSVGGAQEQGQKGAAYPRIKEREIGGRKVKLIKTGQAVRKRSIFSIYAVACYVQEGAKIHNAKEIIDADCAKELDLTMLIDVTGKSMAESLVAIFRQNHPAPAFDAQVKSLKTTMISSSASSGDHIVITHIPKVGLHFKRVGGEETLIRDVAFSKALWENYFGKHNVSEEVKSGLLSLLEK